LGLFFINKLTEKWLNCKNRTINELYKRNDSDKDGGTILMALCLLIYDQTVKKPSCAEKRLYHQKTVKYQKAEKGW
jgi:hypothetical protein